MPTGPGETDFPNPESFHDIGLWENSYQFRFLKHCDRGRWDLFEKAANAALIPWNGSEALKFIPGQPQRKISCAPEVFSACTVPSGSGMGAFYMSRCIGIAAFSKRSQRPLLFCSRVLSKI